MTEYRRLRGFRLLSIRVAAIAPNRRRIPPGAARERFSQGTDRSYWCAHGLAQTISISNIIVLRSWEKSLISPEECYRILPFSKATVLLPSDPHLHKRSCPCREEQLLMLCDCGINTYRPYRRPCRRQREQPAFPRGCSRRALRW